MSASNAQLECTTQQDSHEFYVIFVLCWLLDFFNDCCFILFVIVFTIYKQYSQKQ